MIQSAFRKIFHNLIFVPEIVKMCINKSKTMNWTANDCSCSSAVRIFLRVFEKQLLQLRQHLDHYRPLTTSAGTEKKAL